VSSKADGNCSYLYRFSNRICSTLKSMTDTERPQLRGARKPPRGKRESRSVRATPGRPQCGAHPAPWHRQQLPDLQEEGDCCCPGVLQGPGGSVRPDRVYFVPPQVDVADYDLEDDPHELNLSEYKDARKSRNRRIESMKGDRASLYAFLLLHLSNESLDAIKLQEG
jgi:hypothetical protein